MPEPPKQIHLVHGESHARHALSMALGLHKEDNSKLKIEKIITHAAAIVKEELDSNYKLFLFGSRAKNVHDEKSDIDIGVLSDTKLTAKQILTIQAKLEKIPTLLKIDFLDFNSVGDEFKKTALKHTREIIK